MLIIVCFMSILVVKGITFSSFEASCNGIWGLIIFYTLGLWAYSSIILRKLCEVVFQEEILLLFLPSKQSGSLDSKGSVTNISTLLRAVKSIFLPGPFDWPFHCFLCIVCK